MTRAGLTRLHVDELEVGRFRLAESGPIAERFSLPSPLAHREFVSVRLEASDFAFV